jgi:hypothetical protein
MEKVSEYDDVNKITEEGELTESVKNEKNNESDIDQVIKYDWDNTINDLRKYSKLKILKATFDLIKTGHTQKYCPENLYFDDILKEELLKETKYKFEFKYEKYNNCVEIKLIK